MIPAALLRRAGGKVIAYQGVISFVAASNTVYVDSGTAMNVTIPAAAQEGDALVAFIMHRSALTPPTGWDVLDSQVLMGGPANTTQYLTACLRRADSGDASSITDWVQDANGRMGGHIMCFRGSAGGFEIGDIEKLAVNYVEGYIADIPGAQATRGGQMFVAAATFILANSGSQTTTIDVSSGWIQTSIKTVIGNRLGCAYRPAVSASVASGTISCPVIIATNGIGSMTIVISPKPG